MLKRLPWIAALVCALALAPVAYNPTLRVSYINLLAHWRAKAVQPAYIFIGDSIVAGGGVWGWRLNGDPLSAVNLGVSGWQVWQVAASLKRPDLGVPRTLIVMAGTNDAAHGFTAEQMKRDWQAVFEAAPRGAAVIVTLSPYSRDAALNEKIALANRIASDVAREHSAKVIDLNATLAPGGTILPRFTIDGVHLSEAAYGVWVAKLRGQ